MEETAQQPHGKKELRRQQNDEQRPRQAHLPGGKAAHCQGHACRGAAIGDEVHDGDGVQLHGEHLHGDTAELFRLLVHLGVLLGVRAVDF